MWTCPRCLEDIEDNFDVCWNCGTDSSGQQDETLETADAATDEPIKVTRIATEKLAGEPLKITNGNYGLGTIVGTLLYTAFMLSLVVLVYFRLAPKDAPSKPYLLAVLGTLFLVGCWKLYRALTQSVLKVELGDEFVVERLVGSSHYALSEIDSVEFEYELRMSQFVTLLRGARRLVTFVLRDGQRIRLLIDASLESRIRRVVSP